ncbi:ddx1 [Symbiodinium natans]|uniref:Ddx1 protein n=1 Tax=Symbiodinium natans TaxID=878477 RepID=A0A812IMN4_9DINO|nr:ddx1 [Symbiodinium natans]
MGVAGFTLGSGVRSSCNRRCSAAGLAVPSAQVSGQMSLFSEGTANEREACFYCNRDAWKMFCCPACRGPGETRGQECYMLCEACLANRACQYCQRRPQPQDAFTDSDLRSCEQGGPSLEGSSTTQQGDPVHAGDGIAMEALSPHSDPELWVLVELSCVLLHRSPARLKDLQEDGYDGRREPFYLRPGAADFLREVSGLPQVRLALTTTMRPATYEPLLRCLAQAAFGANAWDDQAFPIFDKRDLKSDRRFADGRDAPALDVEGFRQYARNVLGHEMKEERITLIQSLKEVVSESWRHSVLLIPAMQPSDLLAAPLMLRNELEQIPRYLRRVDARGNIRRHLQETPCIFERRCKDLAVEMDERPPWASEADFAGLPVQKSQDGLEHDHELVVQKVHLHRAHEWHVLGPSRPHRYEWTGVRFHPFPATCRSGSRFEVTVKQGLVRIGWSTAHGSLDLGKDRGEGFPNVAYGGTGKICVCGAFSDFSEPFGPGDIIGCELLFSCGRWLASFTKNGTVMGEIHPFDTLGGAGVLYPHITGKLSFEAKVNFVNAASLESRSGQL